MEKFNLIYKEFGENALIIEWPPRIEEDILYDIIQLQHVLEEHLKNVISEFVPAYQSLTLFFNPGVIKCKDLIISVNQLYLKAATNSVIIPKLWHIPVCYDAFFGIDQDAVSRYTRLSVKKIIELHADTIYTVYFIGFLPGFLYLGGLPDALFTPRKSSPASKVLQGSVAIGGNQTGIYPQENPGGWHVIGNSPLLFLDTTKHPPVFVNAGDKIKFFAIERHEHEKASKQIKENNYKLNMQPYRQ